LKTIREISVFKTIPLWERWTTESLRIRREEIGETAFNRGYRNIAYADADLMFKNVDKHIVYNRSWRDYIAPHFPRFAGVDLSSSKRKGNAIVVIGVIPGTNQRVLIDVERGAWTSTQTAGIVQAVHMKYNVQLFKIENNAYQQSLIDWMEIGKFQNIPISAHTTGANKSHPEFGLPSMAVEIEQGAWIFPYESEHETDCQCGKCVFLSELRSFPLGTDTDTVMAWWFAREAAGHVNSHDVHIVGNRTEAGNIFREDF